MSTTANHSLVNLLLESGVPSPEEAAQLATNPNGGSWVAHVLDSGKVDEQRFLNAIGSFFRVPVISIDAKKIERGTLSVLPSRFVFQHHILPIEVKENSVVLATYDLFNSIGRQLATQLLKKPAQWVLVPRAQLLRAMKTLRHRRGNLRGDSPEQTRFRDFAGGRNRYGHQRRRSGSLGGEIRQSDHSRSHNGAGHGYPRRTAGERHPHSLPHRRNPARSGGAAAVAFAAIGHHFATEGDGAYGHRRAASAAGRPHEPARRQSGDRRARFHHPHGQRRVHQPAVAQPRRAAI